LPTGMSERVPYYWRLSGFYLFYFGLLGTLVPYWSLYLRELGFAAANIGLLMALPQLTKLGAPNLWGWLADKYGRRLRIIRFGNLCAALVFCLVFWADDFWSMAALLIGFSFFWNAVLAQFEVVTLNTLGHNSERYSHVRLWGSVGFIVTVTAVGQALDFAPVTIIPWILLALLWLLWACTLLLPADDPGVKREQGGPGLGPILWRPGVLVFFLCCFLMQMSHGPYYAFFSIYLDELGVPGRWTGALWALGVFSEVLVFVFMHRLMQRYSLEGILVASLVLAALRWLLIGTLAESTTALILAQTLHAASFGSFHAAGIGWVHRTFGQRHAGQGQALYSSIGFGAGWALGAWLAGLLWDHWRADTYLMAAGVALLAALLGAITWWRSFLPRQAH
jgi:PPP family 3-phenylpropionic acid transporter